MKLSVLRRASLLLAFTLPGICWGFPAGSALIVSDPSDLPADEASVVTFLSGRLTAAGFTVTTNVGVPGGSLAGYNQIWDVRFGTVFSGGDITAYVTYLAGGGALFAMGENSSCCGTRDTSLLALYAAAGAGTVTLGADSVAAQTVEPPFTGPVSIATMTFADANTFTAVGHGALITELTGTSGGAAVWGPGTLSNATSGSLITVLDVNFMDPNEALDVSQPLTDNLIAYLAAPTVIGAPPPATPATPAPTTLLLVLTGIAAAGLYARASAKRGRASL